MFAPLSRPGSVRRTAGGQPRRLTAVVAATACGLLASAAAVPATFAGIPVPRPGQRYGPAGPVPPATVRAITTGGMAGWQVAVLALGAALVAAPAAVLADRALAARRAMPALPQ